MADIIAKKTVYKIENLNFIGNISTIDFANVNIFSLFPLMFINKKCLIFK